MTKLIIPKLCKNCYSESCFFFFSRKDGQQKVACEAENDGRMFPRFRNWITSSFYPYSLEIVKKSSKHDENASLNKKLIEISTKKKAYKRY